MKINTAKVGPEQKAGLLTGSERTALGDLVKACGKSKALRTAMPNDVFELELIAGEMVVIQKLAERLLKMR